MTASDFLARSARYAAMATSDDDRSPRALGTRAIALRAALDDLRDGVIGLIAEADIAGGDPSAWLTLARLVEAPDDVIVSLADAAFAADDEQGIEARALHVRAAQQAARTHARRAGMEDMA